MEEQRLRDQTLLNEKRKQLVEEGKTNQELRMAGETVEQGGQELKAAGDKLENAAAQDGASGTGAAGRRGRSRRGSGAISGGVFMLGTAAMAGQLKAATSFNIEFQLITLSNFEAIRAHERIRSVLDTREKKPRANVSNNRNRRSRFNLENDELVPEFCDHILHAALETGTAR